MNAEPIAEKRAPAFPLASERTLKHSKSRRPFFREWFCVHPRLKQDSVCITCTGGKPHSPSLTSLRSLSDPIRRLDKKDVRRTLAEDRSNISAGIEVEILLGAASLLLPHEEQ